MKSPGLKSFGQEFYPHEEIRALRLAEKLKTSSRRELTNRLAKDLPHPSEETRLRLAGKFIQRYVKATRSGIEPATHEQPFIRLVSRLRAAPALVQLLYYELCNTDELVGILARELFYPALVEDKAPEGYEAYEFAALNGSRLLHDEPLLTREFILAHAARFWDFKDSASLDRASRVLLSAGLIARERMSEMRNHPLAYCLADHVLATPAFAWALYDEFLPMAESGRDFSRKDILNAKFGRTFLLSSAQMEAGLESVRRYQLVAAQEDKVHLIYGDQSELTDALVGKGM